MITLFQFFVKLHFLVDIPVSMAQSTHDIGSYLYLFARAAPAARLDRKVLRFVPVAALTAIVVPELLVRNGAVQFTWQNERLVAGVVAGLIAWRTQNVLLTIILGMVCLYSLQWLGG